MTFFRSLLILLSIGLFLPQPGRSAEHRLGAEKASSLQQTLDKMAAGDVLVLEPGLYLLPSPLTLTESHTDLTILAPEAGKTILSGGKRLTGWSRVGNSQRWTLKVEAVASGDWYFRQLWVVDGAGSNLALRRSRLPAEGWFRGETASFVDFEMTRNVAGNKCDEWRDKRLDLYTTLRFKEEQAASLGSASEWPDLQNGEMLLLQSWDTSWHPLRSIDSETRDMKFFTPSRYPMNHWQYSRNTLGAPYRLENLAAGLLRPGDWCVDRATGIVTLLADDTFDPNEAIVVAPASEQLLTIDGRFETKRGDDGKDKTTYHRAKNIRFEGVVFSHNAYPVGHYDMHKPDWPERLRKLDPDFPQKFPGGITDAQAAPNTGAAIELSHASGCVFERCQFRDIGNWAVHFNRDTHANEIRRSEFVRTGSGALKINGGASLPDEQYPTGNVLADCLIRDGGTIQKATTAVWIANSRTSQIEHNEIRDYPYSAISVGWNWSRTPNQCYGNAIVANHIHHVTGTISDGAGIYTLGILGGTKIHRNYIHDVQRAPTAVGAGNTGMLFDQWSLGLHLDGNVIRRVQSYLPEFKRHNEVVRHFRNSEDEHVYGDNDFADDDSEVRLTETVENAGPRPE